MEKEKAIKEWLKQAEYDYGTALSMFETKRYIYSVFMCHLAIESSLFAKNSPKIHDLNLLVSRLKLDFPEDMEKFVDMINGVSVPLRYPDSLSQLQEQFTASNTQEILANTKEVMQWLQT